MNGVEAAASLFGDEESSSDPFATLGSDTVVAESSSGDLFFEGASGSSDFLSPEEVYNSEGNTEQDFYAQQEPSHANYTSQPHTSDAATTSNQQAWSEEQVQADYFGEQAIETAIEPCKVPFLHRPIHYLNMGLL